MAERKKKQKHGLESETVSFGEMLSGAQFFIMPLLQRPYAWTHAEVGAMIADLLAAWEAKYRNYVLGQVIGLRAPNREIEIVDGQQRLVTVAILFAYLRDRLAGRSGPFDDLQSCIIVDGRVRVTPREADAPYLRDLFQSRDSGPRLAAALAAHEKASKEHTAKEHANDPQVLMLTAARVVRANLDRLAIDALQDFAEFVLDRAIVNFIIADDRTQAAILYRSHNITGLSELSLADLMKLEALENTGLSLQSKEKVARRWDATETRLGRMRFAELLEMMPLLVSREPTKQPGDLTEWRLKAFKGVKAETLILNMLPLYAGIMTELLSGEIRADCRTDADVRALEETNALLKGILFLRNPHWLAPAIAMVYAQREQPQFLLRFFRGLDRLCFACFCDAVKAEKRSRKFAHIVAAGTDETLLAAAFDLAADEKKAIAKRLREPFGRFHWQRRAVAMRANAAFPGGRNFEQEEDVSVEHVLPSSHCEAWAALGWTEDKVAACAELLGNFVLVTKTQNNKAGQKLFEAKKPVYFETPGAPVHAITEDVRTVDTWTEKQLRDRTERLVRLLLAYWKIDEK